MVYVLRILILFILVDISFSTVFNGTFLNNLDNNTIIEKPLETRRKAKSHRSTSSSSTEHKDVTRGDSESLDITFSDSGSSDSKPSKHKITKVTKVKKSYKPKSSRERTGWLKWHRKCTPCPDDMHMKWRDPNIKWICGAYQRARRSFKSLCMMHYRNCQDGTMFTKIADYRCKNSTELSRHGEHFFYDYKAILSMESVEATSSSEDNSVSSDELEKTISWNSEDVEKARNELDLN